MIERTLRVIQLYDIYGAFLTRRQQEFISLYYERDLSLAEIAAEFNITRQAVHDILCRGEAILKKWEQKLGLVEKTLYRDQIIKQVTEYLGVLEEKQGKDGECLALLADIKLLLTSLAQT